MLEDPPGILGVECDVLYVLRKVAVAGGGERAGDARSRIRRRSALAGWRRVIKLRRICHVVIGVVGIDDELLRGRREGAAEHGFVNEIDPKFEGVVAGRMTEIVAELILVLIAQVGEKSDGSEI